MKWVMDTYGWILGTVLRWEGLKILPRRWVVERTFGWFDFSIINSGELQSLLHQIDTVKAANE
jgi:transposase